MVFLIISVVIVFVAWRCINIVWDDISSFKKTQKQFFDAATNILLLGFLAGMFMILGIEQLVSYIVR